MFHKKIYVYSIISMARKRVSRKRNSRKKRVSKRRTSRKRVSRRKSKRKSRRRRVSKKQRGGRRPSRKERRAEADEANRLLHLKDDEESYKALAATAADAVEAAKREARLYEKSASEVLEAQQR